MKSAVGHISLGGGTQEIAAGGKVWFFEMHPYHGPVVVSRRDCSEIKQPGPRSSFWRSVVLWDCQGRKVENGRCVFSYPRPPKLRKVRGGYEVVEPGQNDDISEPRI